MLGFVVLLFVGTVPLFAQQPGNCTARDASTRPECPQAIGFFEKLQAAVQANTREEVAAMVRYPITIRSQGKQLRVSNKQEFLANYDTAFNPAVRCAMAKAQASDVWGNWQGFTFNEGVIWWDVILPASQTTKTARGNPDSAEFPIKITAINNQGVPTQGCTQLLK